MTFTIKSESINGVYIEITQGKYESMFTVSAYEIRETYRKNGWQEAADSVSIEGIEVYTDF